jgi:hypothetical protein
VTAALATAAVTAMVFAPASFPEGVGAGRPPVALSVSPARIAVAAPGSRTIALRNVGAERVVVDIARRAVGRRTAARAWLKIVPARLSLRSATRAVLTVRVKPPRHAEPGDHHVLVLLTTRPLRASRVAVRMRLGVRVRVRVPGRIVRRLELQGLRVHRPRRARILLVSVVNRGNVTVQVGGRVSVSLVRRGHILARLRPHGRRLLLPGARTILRLPYRGRVRGPVTAVVRVRLAPGVARRYRIRL